MIQYENKNTLNRKMHRLLFDRHTDSKWKNKNNSCRRIKKNGLKMSHIDIEEIR